MADTIKSSSELKMNCTFEDGDTRLITEENPRSDISASEINSISSWMRTNNPIIGDKGSANFYAIDTADIVEKTNVKVDLDLVQS